jgi:hypothetical protein
VLRTALRAAAVAVATAVAVSVAPTGGPVRAVPAEPDPLNGLTVHPEWGSITGQGGVLKRGCHVYSYTYSITPPEGIWELDVFITGPGMKHVAAGLYLDGYDPTSGTGTYKLCKRSTRYGQYTIDAKVSTDDGYGKTTEGRLPTDTYRLRRPHRYHHQ